MKKILAMLLAMMMLVSMAGVAEEAADQPTALMCAFTDVTVEMTTGGETQTVELGDLEMSFIVDASDAMRYILTAEKGEEILAYVVTEWDDDKIRATINGVDRTFETVVPEIPGGFTEESLTAMTREMLPMIMTMNIPAIKVAALPKVDLASLVGLFGGESTEADGVVTTPVDVPAEMVTMMIQMLASTVKATAESMPQGKQITGLLDMLVESGLSFAIKGDITDNGDEQAVNIGFYMADQSGTQETASLFLNTLSAENSFELAVDLPSQDTSYTIAKLNVVTDPEASTIDCALDVAGMATFELKTHMKDEVQCIEFDANLPGTAISADMDYGKKDGIDYAAFVADMGNDFSFSAAVTGEPVAVDEYSYGGEFFSFGATADGTGVQVTGTYYELLGTFDLAELGITFPAETADFNTLTSDELNAAIAPVLEAITAAVGAVEEPAA